MWQLAKVREGETKLYLESGWEPFAVVAEVFYNHVMREPFSVTFIYMRREAKS